MQPNRSPGTGDVRLLGPTDPQPAIVRNAGAETPYLLLCDHAGRRIPACLDSLGLNDEALQRHIAWDIGAAELTAALGEKLGAFTVSQVYSRLVIDCNRSVGRDDLVAAVADGTTIPGNRALGAAGRRARLIEIHAPYHARIAAELDRRAVAGSSAALVSIHSFTPVFNGHVRPWQMGVLHDGESASSQAMLALLRAEGDLEVGDNEPYAMDGIDYTIPRHAIARGLPYLELEIRQDLIAERAGQQAFADRLARLIPQAFS